MASGEGKGIALVVGASRGIGLGLANKLAAAGWKVYGTCRQKTDAMASADIKFSVVEGVDVADGPACKQALTQALAGEPKIDLLVVNAGIGATSWSAESVQDLKVPELMNFFQVNTIGPLHVVQSVMDKLGQGAKVMLVSSRVGSVGDNGSGNFCGYRMSKAALNMLGANMAHELGPKGVVVALAHPGFVSTDMTSSIPAASGAISVDECTDGFVRTIDGLTDADNGRFIHVGTGETLPW